MYYILHSKKKRDKLYSVVTRKNLCWDWFVQFSRIRLQFHQAQFSGKQVQGKLARPCKLLMKMVTTPKSFF